jgi:hypothetical protein
MYSNPKTSVYRNDRLRIAVSTLPCVRCGVEGHTQCAHIGGLSQGKGRGFKVSDAHVAALCGPRVGVLGCHQIVDEYRAEFMGLAPWEREQAEAILVARTYILLVERGLLRVHGGGRI